MFQEKNGDEDEPIPGVTIIEKGTNSGSVADQSGDYSIDRSKRQYRARIFFRRV